MHDAPLQVDQPSPYINGRSPGLMVARDIPRRIDSISCRMAPVATSIAMRSAAGRPVESPVVAQSPDDLVYPSRFTRPRGWRTAVRSPKESRYNANDVAIRPREPVGLAVRTHLHCLSYALPRRHDVG